MSSEPAVSLQKHASHAPAAGKQLAFLTVTALGVVYGDIGTSPLYALRECFRPEYGIHPTPGNIVGILALILWTLILVVSVKYIVFILRADNRGEGGILSLLALLLQRERRDDDRRRRSPPRCWRCSSNASSERMPPSPRLSARRMKTMYFTLTTRMSVHRISDSTPTMLPGVGWMPYSGLKHSRSAYSGLVLMSP